MRETVEFNYAPPDTVWVAGGLSAFVLGYVVNASQRIGDL